MTNSNSNTLFRSTLIDNEFCTIYLIYHTEDTEVRRIDKVLKFDRMLFADEFTQILKMNNLI